MILADDATMPLSSNIKNHGKQEVCAAEHLCTQVQHLIQLVSRLSVDQTRFYLIFSFIAITEDLLCAYAYVPSTQAV